MATTLQLVAGDRLTRDEFEERYAATPHIKKAELISGVVYMQAAVRYEQHGNPHADIITGLGTYRVAIPGIGISDNSTVRLDEGDEPQPDALLMILPECGGQSSIDEDGYLSGAPELIFEVAASSSNYDVHDKKDVYRRHGVREYIVWRVLGEAIDWFVLNKGQFERLPSDESGLVKSECFPGLWLDKRALLGGDMKTVMCVLQDGIDSAEHAKFVSELSDKATPSNDE